MGSHLQNFNKVSDICKMLDGYKPSFQVLVLMIY